MKGTGLKRALGTSAAALLAIALTGAVGFLVFAAPHWLPETKGLDPRWRSQEIAGYRTTFLAILAGLLAAGGAYLTWANLKLSRRSHQTDRFAKALQLLADDKPAVRLGGIYALNAVALESPLEVQPVVNALQLHADGEHASEAESRLAGVLLEKLDPQAARDEVLAADDWQRSLLLFAAAVALVVSLLTGDLTRASDAVRIFLTVVTAPIVGAAVWLTWRGRGERRQLAQELQRPLFEVEEYLVQRARDGTWAFKLAGQVGVRGFAADEQSAVSTALEAISSPAGVVTVVNPDGSIKRRHHKRTTP